jgi:hypothetical protein
VRASPFARTIAAAVKNTVERLGPGRPTHPPELVKDLIDAQRSDTRFALLVLGVFAVLAVLLAAVGIYGVVAYSTARRTRELAVRRAIGASAAHIIASVLVACTN